MRASMIHVDLLSAKQGTTDTKLGRTHECVFSDNGLQNPFKLADNGKHDDAIMKPKKANVQLALHRSLSLSHSQLAQMSSYYCEKVSSTRDCLSRRELRVCVCDVIH